MLGVEGTGEFEAMAEDCWPLRTGEGEAAGSNVVGGAGLEEAGSGLLASKFARCMAVSSGLV